MLGWGSRGGKKDSVEKIYILSEYWLWTKRYKQEGVDASLRGGLHRIDLVYSTDTKKYLNVLFQYWKVLTGSAFVSRDERQAEYRNLVSILRPLCTESFFIMFITNMHRFPLSALHMVSDIRTGRCLATLWQFVPWGLVPKAKIKQWGLPFVSRDESNWI